MKITVIKYQKRALNIFLLHWHAKFSLLFLIISIETHHKLKMVESKYRVSCSLYGSVFTSVKRLILIL